MTYTNEDEESKPWAEIDPPKKYRLVRADNMEPLGDWTTNLPAGMEYLERRPGWLPKYVYVDEDGKVVPSVVGVWDKQCGLVKMSWTEYAEYRKNNPLPTQEEEAKFEQASETAAEQIDPTLCRVCGSNCTDFNLDYSAYWCHQCQREYDEDGDPINQDNGEEE